MIYAIFKLVQGSITKVKICVRASLARTGFRRAEVRRTPQDSSSHPAYLRVRIRVFNIDMRLLWKKLLRYKLSIDSELNQHFI